MYKKVLLAFCLFALFVAFFALPGLAQVGTAWVARYNGPGDATDRAQAMALDKSGNIYVTGYSKGISTPADYATIKYYPNGDTAWLRRYNGFANLEAHSNAIAVDDSGNVYVTGSVLDTFLYPPAPPIYIANCVTIKYRLNGDTAWVRKYRKPGSSAAVGYAIAFDDSGNVYVAGSNQDQGCLTIKYYPNGNMVWAKTYGSGSDKARVMTLDKSGNIYVAGCFGSDTTTDYATIKYYPNGDTAWARKYIGPGNSRDEAAAIALDNNNDNVYVTGLSYLSGSNANYATVKYDKNGNELWVKEYNGPGNDYDEAKAMAIDDSDYIYVTGQSIADSLKISDYLTVKYNPDGDTVWTRRFSGTEHLGDVACAIAIDKSDNIYVTGTTYRSVGYENYTTIKYDPAGNLLWNIDYNGLVNSQDIPVAIAVDDSGNAYVTGYSTGTGAYDDYATVKYWQDNPPYPFSLLLPLDGDSVSTANGFDWEATTDPDPQDTIIRYDLYVSQSPVFRPDSTVIFDSLLASDYTGTLDIIKNCFWKVLAYDERGAVRWSSQTWSVYLFKSGDGNGDGKVNVSDVIFIINFLFKGGPYPQPLLAGDANCDGKVTVSDVVYLINYLFKGGPAPGC